MRPIFWLLVLSLSLVLALPAGAASAAGPAADTPIAATTQPTGLSSYGGVTAWSEYDQPTGKYKLVLRIKGKNTYPSVNKRDSPFDVTLGPDTKNKVVATYSRCNQVTDYDVNEVKQSVECDAYKYDLASKQESKLSALSQQGVAEQWPAQWKKNYVVSRVLFNGDPSQQNRCDGLYTRPVKSGSGIKTVDLSRGACGAVTGIAFRSSAVAYTLQRTATSGGITFEVRLTNTDPDKSSKKLLSRSFTGAADLYDSPQLDSDHVYVSRLGKATTTKLVRVPRKGGKAKELESQNVLEGSITRDNGRMSYVEVQGGLSGDPCAPVTPCRIVAAGADPFSSTARLLPPKLVLGAPGDGLLGSRPLPVSGSLTQATWQKGKVTATAPVGGMPIQVLRADYAPNPSGQSLVPTSATATTDGAGSFGFTVPPPVPVFGYYAAVTTKPGIASQSAVVTLKTGAAVTLSVTPAAASPGQSVTFSGTVEPYQAGRSVNIQIAFAPGLTEFVASAPVNPDGTFSVTAPVKGSGPYVADLPANPFDGSDGNATYTGTSPPVQVTVTG